MKGIDRSRGYVIMWRSVFESPIWGNPRLERMYHWIMYRAGYKATVVFPTTEKVYLKPGEFITSYPQASRELKVSVGSIKTYLSILKAENIIESRSTRKYTVISVKDWDELQKPERRIENRMKTERKQNETNNTYNTKKGDLVRDWREEIPDG